MPINWLLKIFNKSNQGSDSYMEVATEFVYFDNKTHSFPRFNRNSKLVELTKLKSVSCKNLKEMERNPEK